MTKKKRLRKLRRSKEVEQSNGKTSVDIVQPRITLTNKGILIEPGTELRFNNFGGVKIARPKVFSEAENKRKADFHLRSKYPTGTYKDTTQINEILNYQVSYFEERVDKALRAISSRFCLHFLFIQYDASKKIEKLYNDNQLSETDREKWRNECSYTRRAYKFLCERIVMLKPHIFDDCAARETEIPDLYDEAIICAEELIAFSMHSDQTRYLFPEITEFTVLPEGDDIYWDLSLTDTRITESMTIDIQKRVAHDAKIRTSYFSGTAFDQDWEKHDEIIGEAFQKMSGMRYATAVRSLAIIPKMSRANDIGVCFIPQNRLIEGIAQNMNTAVAAVEKVVSGFVLSAENMSSDAKNFWNPKTIYRAYRRGLFEIGDGPSKHLTWSDSMFKESWFMLLISVAYGILPPEWSHPDLQVAVSKLQNACGNWFEQVVLSQVKSLGLQAIRSRKSFGQGQSRIESLYGEIDLIAYCERERLLVIGECKMTMSGAEPRFFRDELDDFVRSKKSYASKFQKKVNWLIDNLSEVCKALESTNEFNCAIAPRTVAPIMVTFLPSISKYFIPEFPCVALSEFIVDYKTLGQWAYLKVEI